MDNIDLGFVMRRFQHNFERLEKCIRWLGYKEIHYRQSSLQHSFSAALLTAFCVKKENELSNTGLNETLLIVHALLHDFCEGVIGDVMYRFKSDPRIKYLLGLIEKEAGLKQMNDFPVMGQFFTDSYVLQPGSIEEEFFDAIERLDYFLYAIFEYEVHGNKEFVAVFFRHKDKLAEYAIRFKSIALFYTPEIEEYVKKQIEMNPDEIKGQHVSLVKEEYIQDVQEALRQLQEIFNGQKKNE